MTLFSMYRSTFWIATLYLGLCMLGCQRSESPGTLPPSNFVAPDTLRPVALPTLDELPPSARSELEALFARLQAVQSDSSAAIHGEAAGTLGSLLLTYNLHDTAEPALLNALYLLPTDHRWPYYLGWLYQNTGQYEQAVRYYRRTLDLKPSDVPTHVHLGEVYREMERPAEARPILERALRLDSTSAPAHYVLAQVADDPVQSIKHYQAVLRLQPTATVANYPLGLAYREQGDEERSQTYLAQRGEGKVQLADSLVREIELQRKGTGAKLNRGSRFMQEGRFREAALVFSEAIAEDSTEITGYLNLGVALLQLGEWQRGLLVLEQAIRIDPTNSKAHYNLGLILAQLRQPQAKDHFRTAIEQDPQNAQAHLGLGRVLWTEGQCAAALPHFTTYLRATPDAPEVRIQAAMCHAQVGHYAAARDVLETGYTHQPNHMGLQDALVRVLAASPDATARDGDRALSLAQNLVKGLRRPETLASLAMALAEVGRFPDAIQRQQEAIRMIQQGGQANFVPSLQADLQRYQQDQPSRTPWPAFMFPKPTS